MYLIDFEKLEIGDVILIRSNTRISQLVRQLTQSQYSHAILYVGVASIIDSDGYGVQANNIQRLLIENPDDAVVLRLKERPDNINSVEFFARQKIGTEYSTEEAKAARINKDIEAKEPNRQFCTRFIAQAYKNAEIPIVENPDYCTPEELLNSELFKVVNNVLRDASEKEIEFANSENPLEAQWQIHNSVFKKARELSGQDIQTFEQVNEMIIEIPDIDAEFTEFVRQSGYLDMMEGDRDKNPWHYNADKLIEHYKIPEAIIQVALFFATTEPKTRERLNMTIFSLIQLNKVYPREYIKMEIELYRKLIDFSHLRETEVLKVLKHY